MEGARIISIIITGDEDTQNPFKFAFFLLLGVNVVGVMKHCQMMRRKMEWCKAHPKKCEKWKKHHGMHDGGKMEEKRRVQR